MTTRPYRRPGQPTTPRTLVRFRLPRSRWFRRDRGGGPIETALVLPLLFIFIFAVVHMAMFHLARQAALSAAQVAVVAQQGWGAEEGAGEQRAQRYLDQIPPVLRDADPAVRLSDDGEFVEATVTGTAISVIPWYTHTVSQTARGPVERVTSP